MEWPGFKEDEALIKKSSSSEEYDKIKELIAWQEKTI
jgi:hypothetical protein